MKINAEDLAAFADGELAGEREAEIATAIAADPELARQVQQHRELKATLAAHYAPISDEAVPERLSTMLHAPEPAEVVDFTAAKEKSDRKRKAPPWSWMVGSALAASLALALFLPDGTTSEGYADPQLAAVLEDQLVAEQASGAETRILLSFRNESAEFCRAFTSSENAGIACRDNDGWKLKALGGGSERAETEYRMAGGNDADIIALAQEMAVGQALDAADEAAAKESGWR